MIKMKKNKCSFGEKCVCHLEKRCIPIERFLISIVLLFGIVLLLPFNTFSNHIYDGMSLVAKEEVWGIFCITIGIYQIVVNLLHKPITYKIIGFSLQTFLWSFIGTMFLINDFLHGNFSTGSTTYLTIAVLSFYMSFRMSE